MQSQIVVRQRGFNWYAGQNVGVGRDYTLYALASGRVRYEQDWDTKKTLVHVDADPVPDRRVSVAKLVNYSVLRPFMDGPSDDPIGLPVSQ